MKNIKILHIISSLGRGGRERQLSVLTHYEIRNIEQFIISFYDIKNSYADEYNLPNLIFLPKNKLKRSIMIYQFSKKNKIDLIYAWGNGEVLYAIPIAWLLKIKVINGSIRHGIRLKSFSHQFRSLILKSSKYIVGNSFAGFKANRIKFNKNRNFVLYNGIEDKFFIDANEDKRIDFLKSKKITDLVVIFISIANFIPFKDYFTTLQSLYNLKKEGIDFHYIVIGKGRMESEIKAKIHEFNLDENVSIFNISPDIPELLSISDIMIHSSLGEGCSNAILEAKAAGLKIVASDTGGTNEILGNEDYLFEYKNSVDLENKLKEAIASFNNNSISRKEIQTKTKTLFSVGKMQENFNHIIRIIHNSN